MNVTSEEISRAKKVDIIELLSRNGIETKSRGRLSMCSSPFSSDSNPSFVIYVKENRWHDFSTGENGDVIQLAQSLLNITFQESVVMLNGEEMIIWDETKYEKNSKEKKLFHIDSYTTRNSDEIKAIDDYARSRGITRNYKHGFFYTASAKIGQWDRNIAMMFPHTDSRGYIVGAKFRNISSKGDRFTARGSIGRYICDNLYWASGYNTYIVEGEANANSLCEFFGEIEENARCISFGSVGAIPEELPKLEGRIFIVIDYDQNEKLYQERLKAYDHLGGTPIKLLLPKGVDINSLWAEGEVEILKDLLL